MGDQWVIQGRPVGDPWATRRPWVTHGSLTGRPLVSHELLMRVCRSPMGRPRTTHGPMGDQHIGVCSAGPLATHGSPTSRVLAFCWYI